MVVDDKPQIRRLLGALIEEDSRLNYIGEAETFEVAKQRVQLLRPDLLFLDVALRPGSGFDLLPRVPEHTSIVFITGHSGYAARAFSRDAVDFLVKPFAKERFEKAVSRCFSRAELTDVQDILLLDTGAGVYRRRARSVVAIRAEGKYTRIFTVSGERFFIRKSLTDWEAHLAALHCVRACFKRISRSLIVNRAHIDHLETVSRDSGKLFMNGLADPLPVGRLAIGRLKRLLVSRN